MVALPEEAEVPDGETDSVDLRVGRLTLARRAVLIVLLLFTTVLVLYGVVYVARGAPVHGVIVDGLGTLPPAVDDSLFERTLDLHSGARFVDGNTTEILLDGDNTFGRLWEDLRAAGISVTLQMYYFTPGAVADSIAGILAERARSGVRVLLLLDAFGARTVSHGWTDSLRAAGARIAYLRPLRWFRLDRLSHRSHVRSVVVDGRIGYTGGFGMSDLWLGDGRSTDQWRETNIRIMGPAVPQLQAAFMTGWVEATGELLTGDAYFPATTVVGGTRAGLVFFAPSVGSAAAERFLALSMTGARRTLYISNAYFVPDDQFRRMLAEAAGRGVDVRVLTAGRETDINTARYASRASYDELLRAGVRVFEYRPTMMHAKTFVVDGLYASIGSLNFDSRSISYNDEVSAIVLDRATGAAMNDVFMRDLSLSDEIKLESFSRRSFWERLLEFGASLISTLL
jgi:cardiolipin synthase